MSSHLSHMNMVSAVGWTDQSMSVRISHTKGMERKKMPQ